MNNASEDTFQGQLAIRLTTNYSAMSKRRDIDERDVDRLLSALTDLQIAELFGMAVTEVAELRRSRLPKSPASKSKKNTDRNL